MDVVHIVSLDGDDVARHCGCRGESFKDDRLAVLELGLGADSDASGYYGDRADFRSVNRNLDADFGVAAGRNDFDVGDWGNSRNLHLFHLLQLASHDAEHTAAGYRVRCNGYQSDVFVAELVRVYLLDRAGCNGGNTKASKYK